MRKIYLLLLVCLSVSKTNLGQLNGGTTYPINGVSNAPTSFSTIQDAATYVATNGVTGTGNIILQLQTGYNPANEPAAGITVNAITGTNASRRVIFRPATGFSATISLAVASNATLLLNNVDYIDFDGRPGGVGTTQALTFINTSASATAFTSALRFANSSKHNRILYCKFTGNSAVTTSSSNYGSGVIQFVDAGAGPDGNSFNKIYGCDVNGNAAAMQLIVSRGSTTTIQIENTQDTIARCNLYDNFSNVSANYAVNLFTGNNGWFIDSNSIYQTATRSFTVQQAHQGIRTALNFTGEYHDITNNIIGGNAPDGSGTMTLQGSSTNAVGYFGINTQHSEGSYIIRNTIKNINVTYSAAAGSFSNTAISCVMQYTEGSDIPYIGENVISNLSFTNNNGFIRIRPIYLRSLVTTASGFFADVRPQFFAYNNNLNNLTATGNGAAGNAEILGITCESASNASVVGGTSIGSFFLYDNKISQLSVQAANTGTLVRGITSFNTQGSGSTSGLANYNEFLRDTITGLTTNSTSTSTVPGVASGIFINSNLIDTNLIRKCVISDIACTTTSDIGNGVTGISAGNSAFLIDSNKIFDIKNSVSGATTRPHIMGINLYRTTRTSTIASNQIAIGNNQNTNLQVFGINNTYNGSATVDSIKVFYNSIVISGTPASGSFNSSAIYRGSDTIAPLVVIKTPMEINNNLCINKRTGGTGSHSSIFCQEISAPTAFSSNYNAFISAGSVDFGRWGSTSYDFAGWKTTANLDTLSYAARSSVLTDFTNVACSTKVDNLFINPSYQTNAELAINNANAEAWLLNGKGIAIPGLDPNRSNTVGTPTDIGFNEFTPAGANLPPTGAASAAPAPSTTTTYSFAGRKLGEIAWGASVPTSVTWRYYSGLQGPSTTGAVINAYHDVPAVGAGPFNYSMKLYYTLAEQNQIADASLTGLKKDGASPWLAIGGTQSSDAAGKFVTSTGLTTFSLFTLKDVINPIPVKLVSFTGKLNASTTVDLLWQVTEQLGIKKYEVERSVDGRIYMTIGSVLANNLNSFTYTLNDAQPATGKNYYRLRIVENDGRYNYSQIVLITVRGKESFVIYPVPAVDRITIQTNRKDLMNTTAQMVDVQGKIISSIRLTAQVQQVDVRLLAAGIYFLKTEDGNSYRIVKQ